MSQGHIYGRNDLIIAELKPLYAFILASMTDVLLLENNRRGEKWGQYSLPIPNVLGLVGSNKYYGLRNLVFASSIAGGVAVGENIGLWAFPPSHELDKDDGKVRKQITLAFEIVLAVVFSGLCSSLIFKFEKKAVERIVPVANPANMALDRRNAIFQVIQEGVNTLEEGFAAAQGIALNDNFNRGVNTETVLSNFIKTCLVALNINMSAEGITKIFQGHL